MIDGITTRPTTLQTMARRRMAIVAAAGLGLSASAFANDISWVGFQGGCASSQTHNASWFDGMHWFGFVVPGLHDHAILQAQFDPQGHSVPQRYLHLGDFTNCPAGCPNPAFSPGGDATVRHLSVLDGVWTIDGSSGRSGPGCSLPGPMMGTLTATDGMDIGSDTRSAELTILNTTVGSGHFRVAGGHAPTIGRLTLSGLDTEVDGAVCLVGQGQGNSGTLIVENNAMANFGNFFAVGRDAGDGTLTVRTAGTIDVMGEVWIGQGSTASAEITGIGSRLSNIYSFDVPRSGSGTISITGGGQVSSGAAHLGFWTATQGTATVEGAGSRWDSSGDFRVGGGFSQQTGLGTLSVRNGAQVTSNFMSIGDEGGTGSVEIRDPGSHLSGLAAVGSTWVGSYGEVTIANGASVSSLMLSGEPHSAFIGTGDDAFGRVTVTGSVNTQLGMIRSRWEGIAELSVSGVWHSETDGEGQLIITDGGEVVCNIGRVASYWPANRGSAVVRGQGSHWMMGSSMIIGAPGEVTVEDGGTVTVGATLFLTGRLGVTGDQSRVNVQTSALFYAGSFWTVDSGAVVELAENSGNNGTSFVGVAQGEGISRLDITGAGTAWTQPGQMQVGHRGAGVLRVSDGALLISAIGDSPSGSSGIIGSMAGQVPAASGEVTISGPGTLWSQNGSLHVGFEASGDLLIEDAGALQSLRGYVARFPGSIGNVRITGAGSVWEVEEDLFVGGGENGVGGEALLILEGGATVSCSTLSITPNGTYRVLLNPDGTGQIIAQTAQLDGTLELVPAPGYTPINGDEFTIISYTEAAGAFETVIGEGFTLLQGADALTVRYVCAADFNQDGSVDFFDLSDYLAAFNSGDLAADFAEPFGTLNFFDVAAFLQLFKDGCP
ncbi:MAG: hypothetical protein LAT64_00960 [Phycisphaerales bacterium]|nr:hypothetical protein [Planctomycetota bacterium]MCH8507331.1 hypothetical protein [Phycisphaerales bacterium]